MPGTFNPILNTKLLRTVWGAPLMNCSQTDGWIKMPLGPDLYRG